MKHAFLVIAHSGWEQLKQLIRMLDDKDNDIYIHIDKKVKSYPEKEMIESAKKSHIRIFQEYKVYWGSFEMVQVELFLLSHAGKNKYDYYHLLSGADLPIKPMNYIHDFFEENNGYEFIHFDTDERLREDKEIGRRTRLYHFLQNYRRRYKHKLLNDFFTFFERCLLVLQIVLKVNRNKKIGDIEIKYGSQWFSITHSFADYVLKNEQMIYDIFKYTNCSDELVMQTLAFNSEFKENLYNKNYDNSNLGNLRLIDWSRGKNGNPYTWRISDYPEIKESKCLFARKFDLNQDKEVVLKITEDYCIY